MKFVFVLAVLSTIHGLIAVPTDTGHALARRRLSLGLERRQDIDIINQIVDQNVNNQKNAAGKTGNAQKGKGKKGNAKKGKGKKGKGKKGKKGNGKKKKKLTDAQRKSLKKLVDDVTRVLNEDAKGNAGSSTSSAAGATPTA